MVGRRKKEELQWRVGTRRECSWASPYDWRRPTPERLKRGIWDPEDRRVLVPKVYGWGYGINLHEVARRLRLVRHRRSGE